MPTGPPKDSILSEVAFYAPVGVFFGLAIVLSGIRGSIRWYKNRRIYADDVFFYLSILTFISSTGLLLYFVPRPEEWGESFMPIFVAYDSLKWATLSAVKFSFLYFFKPLVDRTPLKMWWRIVVIICVPASLTLMFMLFYICPHKGDDMPVYCRYSPAFYPSLYAVLVYSIVADIVTDALIISIPVLLLRRVRLHLRQKLSVGLLLCLSIFVIAVNLIRAHGAATGSYADPLWAIFMFQMQQNTAVIMASLLVFRTLFQTRPAHSGGGGGGGARSDDTPLKAMRPWPAQQRGEELGGPGSELEKGGAGAIAVETKMTSMRTMVREDRRAVPGYFGRPDADEVVRLQGAGARAGADARCWSEGRRASQSEESLARVVGQAV